MPRRGKYKSAVCEKPTAKKLMQFLDAPLHEHGNKDTSLAKIVYPALVNWQTFRMQSFKKSSAEHSGSQKVGILTQS